MFGAGDLLRMRGMPFDTLSLFGGVLLCFER